MYVRSCHLCAVALVGLVYGVAHAQDCPAISPASYRAAVGAPFTLNLKNAATDAAIAWDDSRISWTLVRVAGTQKNSDLAPRADENGKPGSVRIDTDGAAVIGVDFKPRVIHLDAAALRKFAHEHADTELPDSVQGDVAVRLVESAKTVIRVGKSEEGQSATVSEKTAQLAELRPVFDPSGIGIGSDIPIQAAAGHGKVKTARLIATHIQSGERQDVRAGPTGTASIKLSKAGEWRVEFYHLAQVPKGEKAEDGAAWVLSSGTLTFETAPDERKGEKHAEQGATK